MEETLAYWVDLLRLAIEAAGALVIAIGFLVAIFLFLRSLALQRHVDFLSVRLIFARYLSLALEFQLGADILSTAITPTWEEIGELAAIAVIRTGLNYFLTLEMKEEEQEMERETKVHEEAAR